MYSVEKRGGANNLYSTDFRGKASDLSRIDVNQVSNGSTFYDMTTSNTYMFDAEDKRWILQKNGGGGGGTGLPIYLWTSGSRYEVDDLVIKDGSMYICTVANSDVVWDENHWSAIGSEDGNYGVVNTVGNLPSGLTPSDRKIYFVEEDEDFYLWNGTEWKELNTTTEPLTLAEIDSLFD